MHVFYALIYCGILFNIGAFALGSILWQKHCFLKTFCSICAINIVCSLLITKSFDWLVLRSGSGMSIFRVRPRFDEAFIQTPWFHAVVIAFAVAVVAFVFWLAYKRFTETELVDKW